MTEQEALLVLNAIGGLGNIRILRLIEHFGSAVKLFDQKLKGDLSGSGVIPESLAQKIFDFPRDTFLKNEYNQLARLGIVVQTIQDAEYPERLREIPDAPIVLYQKGKCPEAGPAVAFVGSRHASVYGMQVARKLSGQLSELGITIVSGLARGIDASSHEGALLAKGLTVGVLGCGLAKIYPPEHEKLAARIAKNGAVISEFPMTMLPLAYNFPRRNRIISGMSLGVVVVEAARKSGALITASFALEQGRDVFAVPGPVDHPNSQGVHELIQQGAKLVTRAEDILEELAVPLRLDSENFCQSDKVSSTDTHIEFSQEEEKVLTFLNQTPIYIDVLIENVCLSRAQVLTVLLSLEMKKRVRQLPGKYFIRLEARQN